MLSEEKEAPDYIVIFVIITLLTIGLIMILSASSIRSYNLYEDSYYLFKNQLIWAIIGLIFMLIFMNINYKFFQKHARLILLGSITGLILVLIPGIGRMVGGSRRWIGMGPIGIQPSEVTKLGIVFYLAQFLSTKKERVQSFLKGVIPLLIVLVIIFLLILLEPDLGTAVTITGTFLVMLFTAGIKFIHILYIVSSGIPLIIYFIFSEEYRKARFLAFLNPWEDPLDTGYHVIQSLIALGSGGIFGVGLGNSRQKFLYLPEPGTDFIFAVLGEELGLIGTILIILLYFVLIWRGLKIALYVPDMFGSLLAIGITSMIGLQAIINMGVVTSSLPVTGITLPFISYGGTSLVIMLSGVGILLNISRNKVK
ncbi:MAG: stage V sporulation protein E [Bacillota bacterium]